MKKIILYLFLFVSCEDGFWYPEDLLSRIGQECSNKLFVATFSSFNFSH